MALIEDVVAREVLDSRGNPTVEVEVLLEDGTAQIIWFTGDEHHYDIPAELDGVPVTSIGCRAFSGCSLLHSVVVPEGVEHIGYWAFRACYKLREKRNVH